MRIQFQTIVEHPSEIHRQLEAVSRSIVVPVESDGIAGLVLQDMFKKRDFGVTLGLTVLSLRDMLTEAVRFEMAGILLTTALLAHATDHEALMSARSVFQSSLDQLSRFDDQLRYHHIRMVGP